MPACCTTVFTISNHALLRLEAMLIALGATIAAMLVQVAPVMADEAYVCEGGRIVTVRFGELEKVAKTDPCIARYLSNRSGVEAAQPAVMAAAMTADVPLPVRKPANVPADAPDTTRSHAAAKANGATEVIVDYEAPPAGEHDEASPAGEAEILRPRVVQIAFPRASNHFYSREPLPTGPVDFRNVPIINAVEGEPTIFHHTR